MAISSGVNRTLFYKKETNWGDTALAATGASTLRRVRTALQLTKDTYQSNEIVAHQQVSDFRHGARRVSGTIEGELSPKTWQDFFLSIMRKPSWATTITATSVSLTIGAPTNGIYPLTRGAGSWLSDGFKVGMSVRLSVGTLNALNLLRNFLIVNITSATAASVIPDGGTCAQEGPIAGCTVTATGKYAWAPGTSQQSPVDSFVFEDFHNIAGGAQSERFWGNRINSIRVALPPTGMATVSMDVMGKDMTTGTSQWASSPSNPTTTGVCAAVNGAVVAGATMAQQLTVTGAEFTITANLSTAQLVGSNVTPDVFSGRVGVTGQLQAYFENGTLRDEFINETESGLILYTKADGSAGGSFLSFAFPRVKWGSATKDDGEKGVIQTLSFTALYNGSGGAGNKNEATTILMQDSDAV